MHSVQFSSRRYLCAWKSPYMRSTLSLRCFPNRLPLKQPQCRLIGWPSHPFKEDRFLFPRISPPGDRWCSVLGSATLKATCEGCFARQSICSVSHFPSLWYVQGSTSAGVFEDNATTSNNNNHSGNSILSKVQILSRSPCLSFSLCLCLCLSLCVSVSLSVSPCPSESSSPSGRAGTSTGTTTLRPPTP